MSNIKSIKFITLLIIVIICFSIFIIGILFFWAVQEIYFLRETTINSIELIASLRKIQGLTNELLITKNLDLSYIWWHKASDDFKKTLYEFNNSPRLKVLLRDPKILIKYKAFSILSKRAFNSLERIEYNYKELKNRNINNVGLLVQPGIKYDKSLQSIADEFMVISNYFSTSFENTINPLVISLKDKSRTLQKKAVIIFLFITFFIIIAAFIFSILLRKEEKRRISEIMKIENERNKLESIGVFAGGVAHDFNNILTAIVGNISLAKTYIKPKSELYEIINEVEKASSQAKGLTQQFLTFSKGGDPIKELTDIKGLIKETTVFVLRGSNISFNFSFSENLWNVEIDKSKICEVINNIIINSMQAMPDGGKIWIKGENIQFGKNSSKQFPFDKYVHISIQDEGIGIPKNIKLKVFDPYFSTKELGSGLGLSVSYSIIKKHGGIIDFESEEGKGTTFHIYLRASQKKLNEYNDTFNKDIKGEGFILFMDDEESIRIAGKKMLQRLGYKVVVAKDGNEAIDLYMSFIKKNRNFKAVILDLTVANGIGGKETIKKLIAVDPQVKAIVSSGYSSDPIMAHYKEYGFKDFLKKAYTINELSRVLDKVINNNESNDL